jgi:hypothetical protein
MTAKPAFPDGLRSKAEFWDRNKAAGPATRSVIVTKRGHLVAVPNWTVAKGGVAEFDLSKRMERQDRG